MAKQGRAGLGLWDRLVLLVAWTVTCGLVYVLGFYVGKGTQERRIGVEDRVVRLPVTSKPPPEGQRPKTDSELTFYDTLASGQHADRDAPHPPADGAPAAPSPHAAGPPPTAAVAPAPPVPAHPAAPPPRPGASAAPAAPVVAASPARPPGDGARPAPAVRPVAAPAAAPAPPAAVPPSPATASLPSGAHGVPPAPPRAVGGGWTVQANPTRSRDEAEALYHRLRGRGYDASVVRVLRDGDTWYRVQVGRFATSEQATETMQRLREREGVSHVFVASE